VLLCSYAHWAASLPLSCRSTPTALPATHLHHARARATHVWAAGFRPAIQTYPVPPSAATPMAPRAARLTPRHHPSPRFPPFFRRPPTSYMHSLPSLRILLGGLFDTPFGTRHGARAPRRARSTLNHLSRDVPRGQTCCGRTCSNSCYADNIALNHSVWVNSACRHTGGRVTIRRVRAWALPTATHHRRRSWRLPACLPHCGLTPLCDWPPATYAAVARLYRTVCGRLRRAATSPYPPPPVNAVVIVTPALPTALTRRASPRSL